MDLKFTISPIIAEDTQEIEKFLKSFFYQVKRFFHSIIPTINIFCYLKNEYKIKQL